MTRHRISKAFRVAATALLTISLLAGAGGIQAAGGQGPRAVALHNGHEVAAGEILVKFRDPATAGVAAQEMDVEMDADHDEEIGDKAKRRIHSRRYDTATLLAITAKRADIEYAEPNYIVHTFQVPPDPGFNLLWGLNNTGQTVMGTAGTAGADIRATQAWAKTTGSPLNVVAVIDTGIDYMHPDLSQNVWSAPSAFTVNIGGQAITCAAGTHGFNAITNSCDPMDDFGHGTHVSGTIGAVSNNVGVAGVNWNASIMGVKFLDRNGGGTIADAIKAIEFAIQVKNKFGLNGGNVRVLSNSWGGGGFSQALYDEIMKAYANDMLFVAAAGNAGSNNDVTASYPSSYNVPNVVAVAATDSNDGLAWFSNYGAATVALGAPGVNIYSTMSQLSAMWPGKQYEYLSGTSMATPHVSGVAALVLAVAACGNLDAVSLKNVLLTNTDTVPSLASKINNGRRLNAAKAVTNCAAATPPPTQPPSQPPAADFQILASPLSTSVKRGKSVAFTVTAAAVNGSVPGPVSLTVAGLPNKTSASFTPNPATKSTMTVKTNSKTPTGTFTLTITGTSGSLSHTATVSLRVR